MRLDGIVAGAPVSHTDLTVALGAEPRLSDGGARLAFEMDAAVWTAIGILAAMSLGTLFYLGARIGQRDVRKEFSIDARFDHVDARFDALIGRMDSRFDALDAGMDSFSARRDSHLDRHAG